ncbi:MAG: Ger(x)C family spore germination protein [Desulfitobacteriia bacterium]|jgi:spore germination protein KC
MAANKSLSSKLKFLFSLSLILLLLLSGCWSRRELKDLAIVSGVGFDQTEHSEQFRLTIQVFNPSSGKESGGKNGGESGEKGKSQQGKTYVNFSTTGDSPFLMIRELTHLVGKELYFPHNKVLVFGRQAAESGVEKFLDIFLRDPGIRLNIWVLVAEEEAKDLFEADAGLEEIPSSSIDNILRNQYATSDTALITLKRFAQGLASKATAPIIPKVKVLEENGRKSVVVANSAVFRGEHLVGELDRWETRGLLWVLDEISGGIVKLAYPPGQKTNLEIMRSKTKVKAKLKDEQVEVEIKIRNTANLGSQSGNLDLSKKSNISDLSAELNKEIEREIKAAFKKAVLLEADIFGFGDMICKNYPKEWKELEDRWMEIFPEIKIKFDIETKIRGTGKIVNSIYPSMRFRKQ